MNFFSKKKRAGQNYSLEGSNFESLHELINSRQMKTLIGMEITEKKGLNSELSDWHMHKTAWESLKKNKTFLDIKSSYMSSSNSTNFDD
jgi:hypothetical protein